MGARAQSDTETLESEEQLSLDENGLEVPTRRQSLFVCWLCDFNATGPLGIVEHIKTHSREAPWDCWRCSNVVSGRAAGEDEPHDPTCLDVLECSSEMMELCEDLPEAEPNEEHKCTLCTFKSRYLYQVVDHIKLHMRKRRQELEDDDVFTKKWENVYTCTLCEFSCIRPNKLEKHMDSHGPDASFKCRDCDAEFSSRKDLQRHKRAAHGFLKPFECSLCSAKFTRMDNLKTHINNHSGQRRFPCKLCSYTSPSKARLAAHYACHRDGNTREKGVGSCPVCKRTYTNYSYLLIHLKTHFSTPPYACGECSAQFDGPELLFDHQTEHVDAVALPCAFCRFKCFDDSTMHNHLGAAHGKEKPFQCETCGYRFSSIVHWKRHQLVHTGEKPFSCDLCHARFSQSGNRKAHMVKIHNIFIPLAKGRSRSRSQADGAVLVLDE